MNKKFKIAICLLCVVSFSLIGCKDKKAVKEVEEIANDSVVDNPTVELSEDAESILDDADTFEVEVIEETDNEEIVVGEEDVKQPSENNPEEQSSKDWISQLSIAEKTNQIIAVTANGESVTLSLHNKSNDGVWSEELNCSASIGKNGLGKTKEGDKKTPVGVYNIPFAFGNKDNPGCQIQYTKVDDSYYWVDDANSAYYNMFVSTNQTPVDWTSAEHISAVQGSYNYVLATDYNFDRTPGAGSAIFIHCKPTSGAGCIAIEESSMLKLIKAVRPGCVVVIDNQEKILNY